MAKYGLGSQQPYNRANRHPKVTVACLVFLELVHAGMQTA